MREGSSSTDLEQGKSMGGAASLVRCLEDIGVKHIYGYTGGVILPVYDELRDSSIEITINANEQCAVFSAAAWSRSSRSVGVAIVTSGPGVTNALTAVADAAADSIPLILICGQVVQSKLGTDAFQYIDTKTLFSGIAKKSLRCSSGVSIEKMLKEAYVEAISGKPGPVVIDFPFDCQKEQCEYASLPLSVFEKKENKIPKIKEEDCRNFFALLSQAKRPLFFLGGGLNSFEASSLFRQLHAKVKLPVVTSHMGKGVVDERETLSVGMLGMFGRPSANIAVQKCDLLIALGVRFDDRVAGNLEKFAPQAKIIHLDINEKKTFEIAAKRKLALSLTADACDFLRNTLDFADKETFSFDWTAWCEEVEEIKSSCPLNFNRGSSLCQAAGVMEELSSYISEKTIVATGVGNHQMLAAQYLPMSCPKSFLSSGAFGTMGFAIPTAIGAAHAHPDKEVLVVDGDGSLLMNIADLHTIVQQDIPVKILLLNNHSDGMVCNLQDAVYGKRKTGTQREKNILFSQVAQAMGFSYTRTIEEKKELKAALAECMSVKGSAFLEIMTDKDEVLYPKTLTEQGYESMNLGPYMTKK